MSKRNRGRTLSADGIAAVRTELSQRGWSRSTYADMAELSASTITRMLGGKAVDLSSLINALSLFGLDINLYTGKIQKAEPMPPVTQGAIAPSYDTLLSFYMNVTYTIQNQINQLMVERLIIVLKGYLVGHNVEFKEEEGRVTVVGAFEPERRGDIEAVLSQLENFCIRVEVSGLLEEPEVIPQVPVVVTIV